MVSFYRLKYTNFISSDNYLVGFSREINPESRFLALGTRKNYVVADLNYSCFLARRASLFLFGSLVRRSHPTISFGYQFYDYKDLFNEFSTLSVSYVRDWVPGLLTNHKALLKTALKAEGALRRVGFFFQFPDILLMFGANNSIGFIINEARSLQIPVVATGDASLSFSQVTYMLLGSYKSFKSTMFFVKLFLDLNAESRRFRVLRHYSVFKRMVKSVFLRRTLRSKLFSIKLARMFFIFKAVPKLRVSQVVPSVYKESKWSSAGFFKVSGDRPIWSLRKKATTMRRMGQGSIKRLILVSKERYTKRRRALLRLFSLTGSFRSRQIVLNKRFAPLARRRPSLRGLSQRPKNKISRDWVNKVKLTRNKTSRKIKLIVRRGLVKPVRRRSKKRRKKLRKLLMVARKHGLGVGRLFREADTFLFARLEKLESSGGRRSEVTPLPVFIPDKRESRDLFPFLGYFAYGHMSRRLSTLLFYRALFRQVVQKRKRILRFKGFANNLRVISTQAKRFKALNSAIRRRASSIRKLRARFKKFNGRFKAVVRLGKARKAPGFDEESYIKKFLKEPRKLPKQQQVAKKPTKDKGGIKDKRINSSGKHKHSGWSPKFGNKQKDNRFNKNKGKHLDKGAKVSQGGYDFERSRKAKERFAALMDDLYKQEVKDSGISDRPSWLKDWKSWDDKRKSTGLIKKKSEPRLKKKVTKLPLKGFAAGVRSGPTTLLEKYRALTVKNFTPTQRHVLRVYRLLTLKYPSFVKRAEKKLKSVPRVSSFPRTLYQFLVKRRRRRALAIFKRTGKWVKLRPIELPKPPRKGKRGGFKRGKDNKPWHKGKDNKPWHKGKDNSGFKQSPKIGHGGKGVGQPKEGYKEPYKSNYPKQGQGGWHNKVKSPKNYDEEGPTRKDGLSSLGSSEHHKPKPSRKKDKRSSTSDKVSNDEKE